MSSDLKAFRVALVLKRQALEQTLLREEMRELQAQRELEAAREDRARAEGALGIINATLLELPDNPPASTADPVPTKNPPGR